MDPAARSAALAAVEAAVNRALALDPATRAALAELDGCVFHIELTSPATDLYLLPGRTGIALHAVHDGVVDTHLHGSIADFVELLAAADAPSVLINGAIRLTGDSAPLLRLQAILHRLELDLEAPLARVVGDVGAHQLGRLFRHGRRQIVDTARSALRQGREFAIDEAYLAPDRARVQTLFDDIGELAAATDRLAEKVERTRRRIARLRDADRS